jgi:site-specific DNA recombinase
MEATEVKTYDALIRVSKMNGRKESAESTMTLDDQAGAIRHAIKATGGRRGKTFEALDQSGFTIHRSDAYRLILERVRSGKSDGIVVAYGDRLTRNWRAVGAFYDELEAAGAEVIIAGMPGVDYRTAAGRTMTGLMAVMSDAQYMTAKARGDAIADAVLARGVPNRVPYGYRRNADPVTGVKTDPDRDGKALVPDDVLDKHGNVVGGTARVARRIFEMRGDGYAWSVIVRTLNEAGVPAPNGRQWVTSSLSTIIRNEAYTGLVRLKKRRVEGAHEPLVTPARWRRVQSARPVVRNGNLVAGIAGGLLECSGCGQPLSVIGNVPLPVRVTSPSARLFSL